MENPAIAGSPRSMLAIDLHRDRHLCCIRICVVLSMSGKQTVSNARHRHWRCPFIRIAYDRNNKTAAFLCIVYSLSHLRESIKKTFPVPKSINVHFYYIHINWHMNLFNCDTSSLCAFHIVTLCVWARRAFNHHAFNDTIFPPGLCPTACSNYGGTKEKPFRAVVLLQRMRQPAQLQCNWNFITISLCFRCWPQFQPQMPMQQIDSYDSRHSIHYGNVDVTYAGKPLCAM